MGMKHAKSLTGPDGVNPDRAQPSHWNADHVIDGDVDFDGHAITDPADPTAGTHVGDRDYNDARYDADGDAAAAQAAAEATAAAANTADIAAHAAIVDSHHAKYTDAEALAALVGETVTADAATIDGVSLVPATGVWTPELTFSTVGDFSPAYSTQTGTYTRYADRVHCDFVIVCSSFTHTTASGDFRIGGLPFTAGASSTPGGAGLLTGRGWTQANTAALTVNAQAGQTWLLVYSSRSASSHVKHGATQWPTGGTVQLYGSITYEV